jgi:competence protein ComEC
MKLERLSLFNTKREFFLFFYTLIFIFCYSLLMEYHNFKTLTQFDSNLVNAIVLKQYDKTKVNKKGQLKSYQMLKLKSDKGFNFYTGTKKSTQNLIGKKVQLELFAGNINFLEYLNTFYASSRILEVQESLKYSLNQTIASQHKNLNTIAIYKALYTAIPLPQNLQITFSNLGISHLFAISGFHLGVLSFVLFFLLKLPYKFFQDRYFPYRHSQRDLFLLVSIILLIYLLFLETPSSLLRAFTMLIIGFFLYDRGIKIISMQTLSLTILILLALFPRLFFELGFWLSVSGVFYIFLFFIHFKNLSKLWQFILIPFWVYFLMLPYSLVIFTNFSLYHPLSILWTSLFSIFYPLSILLHLVGFGNLLDSQLESLIQLGSVQKSVIIESIWLYLYILISILSIFFKKILYVLGSLSLAIFIYSIYQIT